MEADDDELELLWLSAQFAPYDHDRADALLEYAKKRPEEARWREQLRAELRPQNTPAFLGSYLNCLTLFPEHGAFAVPEILQLTRHPHVSVRGWAIEVLRFLVYDYPECVSPEGWVDVIRERLDDWLPDIREEAESILDRVIPDWRAEMKTKQNPLRKKHQHGRKRGPKFRPDLNDDV
jgi:hypothetical protein